MDALKVEYETALKTSGYENVDFKYNLVNKNNWWNRQRNITWFNTPFSQTVLTNVAKRFLDLLNNYFSPYNKLHKIFNRNTVKVSYSCTHNVSSIIKWNNKKLTNAENKQTKDYNCRKKEQCPLESKPRSEDVIYICVVTATCYPRKVYLGTAKGHFKQRCYNHKKSFRNRKYANKASLSKYIWEINDKHNIRPNLMCCIVKSVSDYSNILKRCMMCLYEKHEILNHPVEEELLNKSSEVISKCWHVHKFLKSNYKSND